MKWRKGKIRGVDIVPAVKYEDRRGWLAEIYRSDEISRIKMPVMGYVSVTRPGVSRGPHEHLKQTDMFCFIGPGNFRIKLWDNRKKSPTYGKVQVFNAGEKNPLIVTVPPGVVHGYRNVSMTDAMVLNFPNRLFAGRGKKQPVDEVRYEGVKNTPFVI